MIYVINIFYFAGIIIKVGKKVKRGAVRQKKLG